MKVSKKKENRQQISIIRKYSYLSEQRFTASSIEGQDKLSVYILFKNIVKKVLHSVIPIKQ